MVDVDNQPDIDRRKLLKLTGTSSFLGIAGCLGDDDGTEDGNGDGTGDGNGNGTGDGNGDGTGDGNGNGTGDSNGDGGGGDPSETPPFRSGLVFNLVEDLNWNPFTSSGYPYFGQKVEFPPLAVWDRYQDTLAGVHLKDWSIDGSTVSLELNEGFTWTNGDPVTAKDLETQLRLEQEVPGPVGTLPDVIEGGIQAVEDYIVEMELVSPDTNNRLLRDELFSLGELYSRHVATPQEEYREYVEQFEDATTDDERTDIAGELVNYRLEEPVGIGPFHFNVEESATDTAVFDRRDDYPLDLIQQNVAEQTGYDFSDWPDEYQMSQVELVNYEGRARELMLQDELDANVTFGPTGEDFLDQLPEQVEVFGTQSPTGGALIINHESKWFGQREVRQALALALPREQLGRLSAGIFRREIGHQSGISPFQEEQYLPESFLDNLREYPANSREEAEDLLTSIGWSKEDGQWHDEDGELVEFQFKGPSDRGEYLTAVVDVLSEFGFAAETQSMERTAWQDVLDTGDYELTYGFYGGGPHPVVAYREQYVPVEGVFHSYPEEVSVPAMPGESSSQTINVREAVLDIESTNDEDMIEERLMELAWVFNQDLPTIEVHQADFDNFISHSRYRFPEPNEDPWLSTGFAWWYAFWLGLIQPQTA